MPTIRLVMIEDAAPFAQTLAKFFRLDPSGIECVAIYPTAEEALRSISAVRPDVALGLVRE